MSAPHRYKHYSKYSVKRGREIVDRVRDGERISKICCDMKIENGAPNRWAKDPKCKIRGATFGELYAEARQIHDTFDEELARELCDRVAQGETQTAVAAELGVGVTRLNGWRSNDEYTVDGRPFHELLAEARAEWGHALIDRAQTLNVGLQERLTGDRDTDNTLIQSVRQETSYAQWYVSKVLWPLYGDRVDHRHSGEVEHQLKINVIEFKQDAAPALVADGPALIEGETKRID